jgi:hypothetical protein
MLPNMKEKLNIFVLLMALVLGLNAAARAEPMGTAFTYRGQLYDANYVADGLYDFQFRLYDANTDGNQVGDDVNKADVNVVDAYFAVELDFGSSVFDGDARWLEIGVRPGDQDDPCEYTTLEPLQKLTPTPYALYAKNAGSDNDWKISGIDMYPGAGVTGNVGIGTTSPGDKLDVDGHINSSQSYKIAGDTVLSVTSTSNTLVGIGAGENNTSNYGTFVGYNAGYNNQGRCNTFSGASAGYYNTTGNYNTFLGQSAGCNNTEGSMNTFLGNSAGYSNTEGNHNTSLGRSAGYSNTIGHYNAFLGRRAGYSNTEGSGNTFLGCETGYNNTTGSGNVFIGYRAGYFETGSDKLYIANGLSQPEVLIYGDFDTGYVGIGTTSPGRQLEISNTDDAWLRIADDSDNSAGETGNAYLQFTTDAQAEAFDGLIYLENRNADTKLHFDVEDILAMTIHNGKVGIGTTSPDEKLDIVGNMKVADSGGNDAVVLKADGYGSAGQISMYDNDGTETVRILAAEAATNGAEIKLMKADGTTSIELDAEYDGDGRIITQELQITGGSDLSEQFEISSECGEVKPGMVVCIEAYNPGNLVVSKKTYDRTVAGIVSGAGGVKPGMLMAQKGTKADGEHPVALTGRVWTYCDATNQPIEPGDLLTTSDMAGHAMKVTDYTRAQGAVLGKAMTALGDGQGLVLVLVSLQ